MIFFAPIAQLDRASDFGSEGCGFDSYWAHFNFMKKIPGLAYILFFFLFSGCAVFKERDADSLFKVRHRCDIFENVPRKYRNEAEYGYAVYLKVLATIPVMNDGPEVDKVNEIGEMLVTFLPRRYFTYRFTVISDERLFVSSTPGGFIYVSDSFCNYVEGDDTLLASALAVELALTQYRFMKFRGLKHFVNFVYGISVYGAFAAGPYGSAIPKGVKLLNNVILRDKPRKKRILYADKLAVDILEKSGYPRDALFRLIKRISSENPENMARLKDYIALHPVTRERIDNLKRFRNPTGKQPASEPRK